MSKGIQYRELIGKLSKVPLNQWESKEFEGKTFYGTKLGEFRAQVVYSYYHESGSLCVFEGRREIAGFDGDERENPEIRRLYESLMGKVEKEEAKREISQERESISELRKILA